MTIYNQSQLIGQIIDNMTLYITGDILLSLGLIYLVLYIFAISTFRIPGELTIILLLPLIIVMASYYSLFVGIGVLLMILVGTWFYSWYF